MVPAGKGLIKEVDVFRRPQTCATVAPSIISRMAAKSGERPEFTGLVPRRGPLTKFHRTREGHEVSDNKTGSRRHFSRGHSDYGAARHHRRSADRRERGSAVDLVETATTREVRAFAAESEMKQWLQQHAEAIEETP